MEQDLNASRELPDVPQVCSKRSILQEIFNKDKGSDLNYQSYNKKPINITPFYNWAMNILYFSTNPNSVSRDSLYSHPQVSPPWSYLFFCNYPPFKRLSLDFIFLAPDFDHRAQRAPEKFNFLINQKGGAYFYDN
jgi:hypothetical protein